MNKNLMRRSWPLLLALIVALALPITVWAVFVSINTDDGVIDPDWAAVTLFQSSPNDPGIDDAYDIKEAKVTREADNSLWYFQVVLYGQLPLDNLTSVEARISCDDDSAFTSAADKIVLYYHADPPTNDNSIECQADDYPLCSTNGEFQGADFGEEVAVGDGTYSYEWKADIADAGGIDWSACNGQEMMQFTVANETGTTYDTTGTRGFDVPTAVDLNHFGAASTSTVGLITLIGLSSIIVVLWRRARR